MPGQNTRPVDTLAESAIVLQLLSRTAACSRAQLYADLGDIGNTRVDIAIESLASVGIVIARTQTVIASAALQRLDALGLIAV